MQYSDLRPTRALLSDLSTTTTGCDALLDNQNLMPLVYFLTQVRSPLFLFLCNLLTPFTCVQLCNFAPPKRSHQTVRAKTFLSSYPVTFLLRPQRCLRLEKTDILDSKPRPFIFVQRHRPLPIPAATLVDPVHGLSLRKHSSMALPCRSVPMEAWALLTIVLRHHLCRRSTRRQAACSQA